MGINEFQGIEASKVDYKEFLEVRKPKSWLKSVSAFANTRGGHLLFGVTNDTHKAKGVDNPQEVASKIAELIAGRISPAPRYMLSQFEGEDGGTCIDLEIQNGPSYPYYYAHDGIREAFVRRGDRSELASDFELNNLILKGQNKTFDSLPSNYKASDVSFTLLSATYKKEAEDELSLPRDLISMGLLSEDGQITNAGLLLCDQGYLRQSKIVCTRWKGKTKGSVDGDALDDQEFGEASLISLLYNTEAFIRNNSRSPWTVRGMRREEKSDYPYKAVREVLVNAMIHRDYQIVGTEIHVDMFDDRLEIVSPGGMMGGSRIQDMDLYRVPSMRRNEIISDIFGRLRYMDRRGSGIGRILNSYTEVNEKPEFYSTEYYFSVMLPNRSVADPAQVSMDSLNKQDSEPLTQSVDEKTQLLGEKTQLAKEKTQSAITKLNSEECDEDWELGYFKDEILEKHEEAFRGTTIKKLISLFERYRYNYSFNRRNVADLFGITENGASGFIKKCIEKGIIQKIKVDEYKFTNAKTER